MGDLSHTLWSAPAKGPNNRRHGRVKCQDLSCTLGEVLDLSASGMRVRRAGNPIVRKGERFSMTVQTLDGPMLAPVEVTWIRKTGWRRHEVGLSFIEIGAALSAALATMARSSAHNEVFRDWRGGIRAA